MASTGGIFLLIFVTEGTEPSIVVAPQPKETSLLLRTSRAPPTCSLVDVSTSIIFSNAA